MKVVLSHGRGLNQYSKDMVYLARVAKRFGHEPILINDTDTDDPFIRTERLSALVREIEEPFIVAGFSMGGYTSLRAAMAAPAWLRGVFLIAPALYLSHYPQSALFAPAPTFIVHGLQDEVVSPDNSRRFAAEHKAQLVLVPCGHTFRTSFELQQLEHYFGFFLAQLETEPNLFTI